MLALFQAIRQHVRRTYETHFDFILLTILFVTFRLLALVAYRPGGLVLDFSDFYWYREYAQLARQGYVPYENLWSIYPPVFPSLMIAVWQISTLLPPWTFSNLWFTLILGGVFLLFETGNFILVYLLACRLYEKRARALRVAWIYAALFIPVYTLTGWFESFPIFFFLLSLYLLVRGRPYLSAIFGGVGFMVKLIPLLLLPIGVRHAANLRHETEHQAVPARQFQLTVIKGWADLRRIRFDFWPLLIYLTLFFGTIVVIGLPFYQRNPDLILSPVGFNGARAPWETVWALLAGNYEYGIVPQDRRDLSLPAAGGLADSLPWLWITAAFGLVYLILYAQRIDWQAPRALIAFTGLTLCCFFLYSKGYSPQWLGWLLVFNTLLLPHLRGIIYAAVLSVANIVEANVFFIMFPTVHWLLASTVLIRTFLVVVMAIEFAFILWPHLRTPGVARLQRWGLAAFLLLLLAGLLPAGHRLGQVYFEQRLVQSPYGATIRRLQNEPVTGALLLNSHTSYDWFFPYLRHDFQFYMLDDYGDVSAKTVELLTRIAAAQDALWVFDDDPSQTSPAEIIATDWLASYPLAHIQDIDGGRLYLYILRGGGS
jgi:hypothetical protein